MIDVVVDEGGEEQTEDEMNTFYIVLIVLLLGISICIWIYCRLGIDFILINVIPVNGSSNHAMDNPIDVSSVNICEESCL